MYYYFYLDQSRWIRAAKRAFPSMDSRRRTQLRLLRQTTENGLLRIILFIIKGKINAILLNMTMLQGAALPTLQHASWDALEADISMTTGRARFRPIGHRLTTKRAQTDSHESRTPIGHLMQLCPELPQHGTEYENSERARSHKRQGYEKRKVHTLRGSSNNNPRGKSCRAYFSPKIYVVPLFLFSRNYPQHTWVPTHPCPLLCTV